MLNHRLRRWPNINPTLAQRLLFARMLLIYTDGILTRKGVPELQGPALVFLSALDKTIGLIFCKHNCIGFPHGPE